MAKSKQKVGEDEMNAIRQLDMGTIRMDIDRVRRMQQVFEGNATANELFSTMPRPPTTARPAFYDLDIYRSLSTAPKNGVSATPAPLKRYAAMPTADLPAPDSTPAPAPAPAPASNGKAVNGDSTASHSAANGTSEERQTPQLTDAPRSLAALFNGSNGATDTAAKQSGNSSQTSHETAKPHARPASSLVVTEALVENGTGRRSDPSPSVGGTSGRYTLRRYQINLNSSISMTTESNDYEAVDGPAPASDGLISIGRRSAVSAPSTDGTYSHKPIQVVTDWDKRAHLLSTIQQARPSPSPSPSPSIAPSSKDMTPRERFARMMRDVMRDYDNEEEQKQLRLRDMRIKTLPKRFLAKYLGARTCQNVDDPTSVPVDVLIDEVGKLVGKQDLTLVTLTVTQEGLQMQEHRQNSGPHLDSSYLFPIDYISLAVQDMVYERVVSVVFISEISARLPKTECHSFVLSDVYAAKAFALSIQLSFNYLLRRLNGNSLSLRFKLQPTIRHDENHASSQNGHDADA